MAFAACESAATDFALGTIGAGYGATTCNLKGGLGSASVAISNGITIGALAAVNSVGSVTIGDTPHFWAAPFETGSEYGGYGSPAKTPPEALAPRFKGGPGESTTLVIVATDAAMDRLMLKRLAIMAQSGLARAIYPVHTPLDGDIVFAISTGKKSLADPVRDLAVLGTHTANVTARAIARAVYEATCFNGKPEGLPAYKDIHSGAAR
jgi:L-aminopeptidase/D-esterase-like protein